MQRQDSSGTVRQVAACRSTRLTPTVQAAAPICSHRKGVAAGTPASAQRPASCTQISAGLPCVSKHRQCLGRCCTHWIVWCAYSRDVGGCQSAADLLSQVAEPDWATVCQRAATCRARPASAVSRPGLSGVLPGALRTPRQQQAAQPVECPGIEVPTDRRFHRSATVNTVFAHVCVTEGE